MGRTVQLDDLREAVRTRYDLPTFSTSSFITLTVVNQMINASLQMYYGLLCECYGDDYYATTTTLATVANTSTTALPPRFTKLKALVWLRSTDDGVLLKRAQVNDNALVGLSPQTWTVYEPRYRLFGTTSIRWFPTPAQVYSIQCDYIALPADLTNNADTFEAGPGHEEWVILDVCRKIAGREEKDTRPWMGERADVEARIRAQAPDRDEVEPLVLRDVWGHSESDYSRWERLTRMQNG